MLHAPTMRWAATTAKNALWAPLLVVIGHELLGSAFGHEPVVDPIAHFSGGVAAAYFIRYTFGIAEGAIGRPNALGLDLLAFGLTVFAAFGWELAEYLSDVLLGTSIQVSAPNLIRDLCLGTAGGALFLVVRRLRQQ